MKASDLMVKCLLNEDVEYIFGLPGEENIEFLDSLSSSSIKFITTRHEQGAAFMADVYGRIKQKAGVCLSTLGPGAMNLTTGIASSNLDHSPLVAITGQADFKGRHFEQHQYVDVVKSFEPITKWNARITSADSIPELVRRAFRVAQMEKPGATHLELANDIAGEEVESLGPLHKHPLFVSHPIHKDIQAAAELINKSKYPIIISGNGVIITNSSDALLKFAEAAQIPVVKTFMSKGSVSYKDPFYIGIFGLKSRDFIMHELEKADCVVTVGYDVIEYSPKFWNSKMDKTIIDIDTVPVQNRDRYYDFCLELVGDLRFTLTELSKIVNKKTHWNKETRERIERAKNDYTPSFPIKPQHFLQSIRKAMSDSDILVSDVGMHKLWISRLFETYKPNTVVISNGFASMGIALPGAIGAKIAKPDCNVISVSGDGGFLMNVQELETAKRLGISGVHIIWTDNSYGMIEWHQAIKHKKKFGVEFTNPDFMLLAKSFGIKGYKVEKASELSDILSTAIKSGELCLVEVPIDYSENKNITFDPSSSH